jgi:capsular exopolysaccharide synthesis family protein
MNTPQTINTHSPDMEEIIDLRKYFKVINSYKWRILLLTLAVTVLTGIIAMKITPVYSATATLLIEADKAKAISFEDVVGLDSNKKEYYLTQFEILKSYQVAKQVIDRLQLQKHPDFMAKTSLLSQIKEVIPFIPKKNTLLVTDPELTAEQRADQKQQALAKVLLSRLYINPIVRTQLVNISYESNDPQLAADVTNAVGDIYIEQDIAAKVGITKNAVNWLKTQLFNWRDRVDESEAKLQDYLERESLIDVKGVDVLIGQELAQTLDQLVIARNEKNQLESIVNVVNENSDNTIDTFESITQIASHQAVQNIKERLITAKLKVSELALTYGVKHPEMILAQSELFSIELNYKTQIRKLITGIEKKLKTKSSNVLALEKEIIRIRAKYQQVIRKESDYRKLKREVETNRKIYDTFLLRSKETEVTLDFTSTVARFIDRAYRPTAPIKPNKMLLIILAFIGTLFVGIVIAFIVEALNDTIKLPSDIRDKLSLWMLGSVPTVKIKKADTLAVHHFFDDKKINFAESVRTLRTSFVLSQLDKNTKVVEVTSTQPEEGKTFVATNLAFSLGQMEKTILIDADLRRPSIGKIFNIPANHPGLANFIGGINTLEDCTYQDPKSAITIMPSGQLYSNPLELLSSPRFKMVIDELKLHYDRIVIDTPPIREVSDPLIIAQQVDAVIYVVKSDSTRVVSIRNGIERLVHAKAKIAGLVLNQVDIKTMNNGYHYSNYESIEEKKFD